MLMHAFRIFENLPLVPQEIIMTQLEPEDLTLMGFGIQSSLPIIKRHLKQQKKPTPRLHITCDRSFFCQISFPDKDGNYERSTRKDGTFALVFEIGEFAIKKYLYAITYVKITMDRERLYEAYLRFIEVIKFLFDPLFSSVYLDFSDKDFLLRVLEKCSDRDIRRFGFNSPTELRTSECQQLIKCFETLNVTENLYFTARTEEDFKIQSSQGVLNVQKRMKIAYSRWFTRENLMQLNCAFGEFERCWLTSGDLNSFLRSWKKGNHQNVISLEFYTISKIRFLHRNQPVSGFGLIRNETPEPTVEPPKYNLEEVTKDLEATPVPSEIESRDYWYTDDSGERHSRMSVHKNVLKNGRDLVNCNGQLATVIVDQKLLEFIVWDKSLLSPDLFFGFGFSR